MTARRDIVLADVRDVVAYERVRERLRRAIIDLKNVRRVQVGERVSLVFENRTTVLFQIQEMIRAERIVDDAKIQDEIDVYRALLPSARELSATLFIEITTPDRIAAELDRFFGIDRGRHVTFDLADGRTIAATFEAGHSKEDKIAAVHFVRFPFTPDDAEALRREPAALVVDHPNYRARALLADATKMSLLEDLSD